MSALGFDGLWLVSRAAACAEHDRAGAPAALAMPLDLTLYKRLVGLVHEIRRLDISKLEVRLPGQSFWITAGGQQLPAQAAYMVLQPTTDNQIVVSAWGLAPGAEPHISVRCATSGVTFKDLVTCLQARQNKCVEIEPAVAEDLLERAGLLAPPAADPQDGQPGPRG